MNIKPLLNGFLACSLISVATSTLALALTGIGLVRDYNVSQQDPVSNFCFFALRILSTVSENELKLDAFYRMASMMLKFKYQKLQKGNIESKIELLLQN